MFQPKRERTICLGNSLSNYFRPLLIFYITNITQNTKSYVTQLSSNLQLNIKCHAIRLQDYHDRISNTLRYLTMLSLLVVSLKSTPLSNVIFVPVSSGNYRSTINFKSYFSTNGCSQIQSVISPNKRRQLLSQRRRVRYASDALSQTLKLRSIEPLLTHVLFNGTWPER